MVADPGPDVLILTLTWAYAAAAVAVHSSWGTGAAPGRPADTGCRRLLAALCGKYVPKFEARSARLSAHRTRRAQAGGTCQPV